MLEMSVAPAIASPAIEKSVSNAVVPAASLSFTVMMHVTTSDSRTFKASSVSSPTHDKTDLSPGLPTIRRVSSNVLEVSLAVVPSFFKTFTFTVMVFPTAPLFPAYEPILKYAVGPEAGGPVPVIRMPSPSSLYFPLVTAASGKSVGYAVVAPLPSLATIVHTASSSIRTFWLPVVSPAQVTVEALVGVPTTV